MPHCTAQPACDESEEETLSNILLEYKGPNEARERLIQAIGEAGDLKLIRGNKSMWQLRRMEDIGPSLSTDARYRGSQLQKVGNISACK